MANRRYRSTGMIWRVPFPSRRVRLRRRVDRFRGSFSTNTTLLAPLEYASIPMIPEPQNRSRKEAPASPGCRMAKIDSRMRSIAGRSSPDGNWIFLPLRNPPVIRIPLGSHPPRSVLEPEFQDTPKARVFALEESRILCQYPGSLLTSFHHQFHVLGELGDGKVQKP